MTVKISREGFVTDADTGRRLGSVDKIDYPVQDRPGYVTVETRWEARRPHELAVVNPYGFPTFATRREAAAHLAGE